MESSQVALGGAESHDSLVHRHGSDIELVPATHDRTGSGTFEADTELKQTASLDKTAHGDISLDVELCLDEAASWSVEQRGRFLSSMTTGQVVALVKAFRSRSWKEPNAMLAFRNLCTWHPGGDGENDQVLSNVSGYVKPGMMVGVLGQGCTSLIEVSVVIRLFCLLSLSLSLSLPHLPYLSIPPHFSHSFLHPVHLKALSQRDIGHEVSGEIHLNGKNPDERYHKVVSYVSQHDTHHPTLTVRETILYAMRNRVDQNSIPDSLKELMTDVYIKMLG